MKTPIITTNDRGNGMTREMARLIPRDSPNHIIWLIRNFLLLVLNCSSAIICSSGLIKSAAGYYLFYFKVYESRTVEPSCLF